MKRSFFLLSIGLLMLAACDKGTGTVDPVETGDLTVIAYNPTAYSLVAPASFPAMVIPGNNPFTKEGIELGRRLFYDPILSADSTMSCSSCHLPAGNFTDNLALSKGIDGIAGKRSAMSLENVGFFNSGLFWDGRTQTLEQQALQPVEDVVELHQSWPKALEKLQRSSQYPSLFRKAFGIENTKDISKELAAKAIAQFERTLVSSGKSKYDLAQTPGSGVFFSDQELLGFDLFFQLNGTRDAQCGHCHSGPLLTGNEYFNNGLDEAQSLNDFLDKGLGSFTQTQSDFGKFRTPSLRNIALSAPYMHDGRFQTLEQVVDHYATGGHYAVNLSVFMVQLQNQLLTVEEKDAILALLHTMTDTISVNRPEVQNPF